MPEPDRREFTVVLTEQDDGSWLATCQELPGAVSDGASVEEAQQNILEAITGILEIRYQDVRLARQKSKLRLTVFLERGGSDYVNMPRLPAG